MGLQLGKRKKETEGRTRVLLPALLAWTLLLAMAEASFLGHQAAAQSLKKIFAAKGIAYPPPQSRMVVDKAARTLTFYAGDAPLKVFPIALGLRPVGSKLYEWDHRTPEGTYRVVEKIEKKRGPQRVSLRIDYPNEEDRQRYEEALKKGQIPRDSNGKTRDIGSEVMIYGGGVEKDWTKGSIAMRDADIEELFEATSLGTPVVILPEQSGQTRKPAEGQRSQGAGPADPSPPASAPTASPPTSSLAPATPGPGTPSTSETAEKEPEKPRQTEPAPPASHPGKAVPHRLGTRRPAADKTGSAHPFPDHRCSLDLREADVREVLRAFAQEYHLNLLLEEGVEGRLTLQFHSVPVGEAFLAILNANDLGYLYDGNVFRVNRLETLSKRKDMERALEGIEVEVVPLQHTSAEGLLELVQGLKSNRKEAQVIADKRTNTLLLKDIPANLQQMRAAIERLDVKQVTEIERFQTRILRLKYLTVGRLKLDKAPAGPGSRRARGGGSSRSSGSRRTSPRRPAMTDGASPASASGGIQGSLAGLLSANGRVSIDEHNNALIVTDLPENIERIEAILNELDVPARQILIEARIVEANRDFQKRLGVLWSAALSTQGPGRKITVPIQGGRDRQDDARGVGEHTVNLSTPLGTLGVDPFSGIALGRITNRMALDFELNAMEEAGQGRILSTPRITTLDNQEAVIESGLSIPYQKREELGTITIEFADALISLVVIPHVTPDDNILMKILTTKDEADFVRQVQGVPTIITRHASTEVLVRDGETTVIGGLTKKDTNTSSARVPWLGKLPLVGWLFRDQQRVELNEEMLIFITPKIVGGGEVVS